MPRKMNDESHGLTIDIPTDLVIVNFVHLAFTG